MNPGAWQDFAEMTGGASGIVFACGQTAGLYLLLPVVAIAQVSGVLNAWYFLLRPSRVRLPAGHPADAPVAAAKRGDEPAE